jgi:hypothetical protein
VDDHEFIGYCEIHSTTERALFNSSQIARLLRLAGRYENAEEWEKLGGNQWRSVDLTDLCAEARQRIVLWVSEQ